MNARSLLVLGASAGGLDAIPGLLRAVPRELDLCVAMVQHRGRDSTDTLPELLGRRAGRLIADASDGDPLEAGAIYLGPPDYHLLVEGAALRLSLGPPVRFARPSVDVLFEAAAQTWPGRLAAAVLTGANDDGARGAREVVARGGALFVQDPDHAEASAMPRAAIAATTPTLVAAPAALGAAVAAWSRAAPASRERG